jgi:UDP:flavonoid glycosyltransferase YjiC (YdhE family)
MKESEISMVAPWVPQDAVLAHPAVGWFLTHGGWNSTQEGILAKVPMYVISLNASLRQALTLGIVGFFTPFRETNRGMPRSCQ